jgi:hypothetical protein
VLIGEENGIMKAFATYLKSSTLRSALSQGIYYSGSLLNLAFYLFQDNANLPRTILVTAFVYAFSEFGLGWLVPKNPTYVQRGINLRSLQLIVYTLVLISLSLLEEFDWSYIVLHITVIAFPSWLLYSYGSPNLLKFLLILRAVQCILFFLENHIYFNIVNGLFLAYVFWSSLRSYPTKDDIMIIKDNAYLVLPKILPLFVMTGFGFLLTFMKPQEVDDFVFIERHKSLLSTVFIPITYFLFLSYDDWSKKILIGYTLLVTFIMIVTRQLLFLPWPVLSAGLLSFWSSVLIHFIYLPEQRLKRVSKAVLVQVLCVIAISSTYLLTNIIPTSAYLPLCELGLFLALMINLFIKTRDERSQL